MTSWRTLVTCAVLATASGCQLDGDGLHLAETLTLTENEGKWASTGIVSYEYYFQRNCFCHPDTMREVIITVTDEQVAAVRYADSGLAVPAERLADYPSVTGLFDEIRDAIARDPHRLSASYDATLGYPEAYAVTYEANLPDGGNGFSTHDLM